MPVAGYKVILKLLFYMLALQPVFRSFVVCVIIHTDYNAWYVPGIESTIFYT